MIIGLKSLRLSFIQILDQKKLDQGNSFRFRSTSGVLTFSNEEMHAQNREHMPLKTSTSFLRPW